MPSFSKLLAVSILIGIRHALAAINTLQEVTGFGTNPTNVRMFTYKPPDLVFNPALIVGMHWCTGSAQAYFSGTQYANLADTYKTFMVIYPHAPDGGGCWDVHTTATLTHDAGGDSRGIASMVRYAITNYGVDTSRIFMTGTSSGGMMTNVMAGAYPDLFTAGAAFCGVPYACFAGQRSWNSECAQGLITKTAQDWGDLVRAGYPGYTGARPKIQIWHGTNDQTLSYQTFGEAIKEWTNVFGYNITGAPAVFNSPLTGWTRTTYGPRFEAISAQGVDHNIPIQENDALVWFGLKGTPGSSSSMSSSTTSVRPTTSASVRPTSTTLSSASPTVTGTQARWGQCGG
ncbi:hypothetical protein D9619_011593 [Psilocybe cf. subviscida]|uniref:Carboxylic ester hydrolase n=1 Tax=Psilocybe cf. subviscida TaxID=2480587 RepID=A0A8H5F9M5_9AGAR|nr:hypothetical protein D9619_011593 [Psilocybe cf. subviscida]